MCYEKPGPRCSGHTRTNFRKATETLRAATEDLKQKQEALKVAQSAEAKAALEASVKKHEDAKAELAEATKKYAVSKKQRAVAMEAWHEAKKEYFASPEGIRKNRSRSADPTLTAEQRATAKEDAMEGALRREEQKEAYTKKKEGEAKAPEVIKQDVVSFDAFMEEQTAHIKFTKRPLSEPEVKKRVLQLYGPPPTKPYPTDRYGYYWNYGKNMTVRERIADAYIADLREDLGYYPEFRESDIREHVERVLRRRVLEDWENE